ncbi:MAG TPA: HNH endonuclease [Erysipelotrichaceae bacterium]|nr:HNH endonuclease [Erysipelotrichaceae bacterium]
MAREFAKAFYGSRAWKRCRKSYLKSVGGLCERCYKQGLIKPAVIVHHKIYISEKNINNPNITLNWKNLEALCWDCHAAEHEGGMRSRRYVVDETGRVITL